MRAKNIHKIFISVLIFLPLQYLLVGIVGYYHSEPWPAFVLPGFKNVYESNGQYSIQQTHFNLYDSEGERIRQVQPHTLFSDLPRSQISGFMRKVFYEPEKIENLSVEARRHLYELSAKAAGEPVSRLEVMQKVEYINEEATPLEPDSVDLRFVSTIDFDE